MENNTEQLIVSEAASTIILARNGDAPNGPFTALQEVRIREIIREELAAWEKRQSHERRFVPSINYEVK